MTQARTLPRRDAAGYVELGHYAAIGDGRTIALIAPDGRIDWLPLPDLDSVPVFAALLDAEHGGYLSLEPDEAYTVTQHYVGDTNVLATEFTTEHGSVRVTDALNTGVAGRLPWAELARRIDGLTGEVRLRADVVPGTCLNTASPWVRHREQGPTVLRAAELTMAVQSMGAEDVRFDRGSASMTFRTGRGTRQLLGLVGAYGEPLYLPSAEDIDRGIDRTVDNWASWLGEFGWDGPWADAVQRSALVLKLLVFAPTGALAAAATTSLPESPDSDKNWDYRYAWIRDMAYSLTELFRFGLREEIHAAMSWLLRTIRRHGPEPRIFYTLRGELPDATVIERDVPGWRDHAPVRDGNAAIHQFQPGAFGDLLSIMRLWVEHGNVLDEQTSRTLALVADTACDSWRSKDSGMWELATERHYTSSKMGSWKALTDAVYLAERGEVSGDVPRWREEAVAIREWIGDHCWSQEIGAYTWYPGTDELDASVVLHAISGFDRGERMSSTLDALRAELGAGPHLYRYSGASSEEGCFVACSYWYTSALHLVGRRDEARTLLDELMAVPNHAGVLAEMVDPVTGQFWGNLPQALSHLALMHAAITVGTEDQQ